MPSEKKAFTEGMESLGVRSGTIAFNPLSYLFVFSHLLTAAISLAIGNNSSGL
jgi:hypothetical protein